MDKELKRKEVYYLSTTEGEKTSEYRFFKFNGGWHFLITYSSPAFPTSSVEFDLPKELIPTLILEKLDEDFTT